MSWEGKFGPAFVVAVILAALQGLNYMADSRADLSGKIIRLDAIMARATADITEIRNDIKILSAAKTNASR